MLMICSRPPGSGRARQGPTGGSSAIGRRSSRSRPAPAHPTPTSRAARADRGHRARPAQIAAHPARERQRERLLGAVRDVRGKRLLERLVEHALAAQELRHAAKPRPDRFEQRVIDERDADLEAVPHRHDVDVAQQLRLKVQTRLEPGHRRVRRLGARRRQQRFFGRVDVFVRVAPYAAVAQRRTRNVVDLLRQTECALHSIGIEERAAALRKVAPARAQPRRHARAAPTAPTDGPQCGPRPAWRQPRASGGGTTDNRRTSRRRPCRRAPP